MWKAEEEKLNKSGRKWKPSQNYMPYRCAELFCEECGTSLGIFDIPNTNLESVKYCDTCAQKYIKETPIDLPCGTIVEDHGGSVLMQYENSHYGTLWACKTCYFNSKGRYIKVKGKRFYI